VLWSFAVAQPLFDVLSDSPEFFVARGNSAADIVVLAIVVTVVPPTAAVLVELLVRRAARVRLALHLALVAVLGAAIALQLSDDLFGGTSAVLIPAAVAAGAGVAFGYARTRLVPSILTVLAPVPVVFACAFLFLSPVSKLVLPASEDAVATGAVGHPVPVTFVLFDELSLASLLDERGRIDATRFPNFARLAGESTWYRHATTVADETTEAVPAILTGEVVRDEDSLPILADHPRNLFTVLGASNEPHVAESVTRMCPKRICGQTRPERSAEARLRALASDLSVVSMHLLLPDDLESGLPAVDQTFGDFGDETDEPEETKRPRFAITDEAFESRDTRFADFLGGIRPAEGGRPPFHFIHSQLPHLPWEFLPTGQRYLGGRHIGGLTFDIWERRGPYSRQALQRYLLQVGYVDRLLGRVIARLRAAGLYRDSLLVVMADHGVSFRPGGFRRDVTDENLGDIAGIPLMIKTPGQRTGRIDDRPARSVDVLPTIADVLEANTGWAVDGTSLLGDDRPRGRVTVERHRAGSVTVRFDRYRSELSRSVDWITARFGAGRGWAGVYASASDSGLIGADPRSLPVRASAGAGLELDALAALESVDLDGGVLPALLEGRIARGAAPGTRLAFAVNGRIRAVSQAFAEGDDVRFSALVPASAFRSRGNVVEAFRVEGGLGRTVLVPLQASRSTTLAGGLLTYRSGRRVRLTPGAVAGYVEAVAPAPGKLIVTGWAADTERGRPADRVLVFAGGRLLADQQPFAERPDVAKAEGDELLRSGFRVEVPTAAAETLSERGVRVVAVSGSRASELASLPDG
jgi:hypothetical protein